MTQQPPDPRSEPQGKPTQQAIEAVSSILYQIGSMSVAGARRWSMKIFQAIEEADARARAAAAPSAPAVLPEEIERIEQRLREAAINFRIWSRLQRQRQAGPKPIKSWWPNTIINAFEAHNAEEVGATPPVTLYSVQIARMDEAIQWLNGLDGTTQRVVWLRAERVTWRSIEDRTGFSHTTLHKLYAAGLAAIARQIAASESQSNKMS